MGLRVKCSGCQKAYSVDKKYSGRRIACPNCKTPITVPVAAIAGTDVDQPPAEVPGQHDQRTTETGDSTTGAFANEPSSSSPVADSSSIESAADSGGPENSQLRLVLSVCAGVLIIVSGLGVALWRPWSQDLPIARRPEAVPDPIAADPQGPVAGQDGTKPLVSAPTGSRRKELVVSKDGILPPVPAPLPPAKKDEPCYYYDMNGLQNPVAVVCNALRQYEQQHKHYPATRSLERQDEINLSWRVEILPLLGYQALYNQFDHDQPWDSETNLRLLEEMPMEFRSADTPSASFTTQICLFLHDAMIFTGESREINVNYNRIRDKLNTIVIGGVVGPDKAVPWTKPQDIEVELDRVIESLGDVGASVTLFTFFGSTIKVPTALSNHFFEGIFTRDGGELYDIGTIERWAAQYFRSPLLFERHGWQTDMQHINTIHRVMTYQWDKNRTVPTGVYDRKTRKTDYPNHLSWRVHLLHALDYQDLHRQFRFDEPWDSAHNLALAKHMPDLYRDAAAPFDSTTTRFVALASEQTMLDPTTGCLDRSRLDDDPGDTILLVQVPPDKAVPWTKPDDFRFDPNAPLRGLTPFPEPGLLTLFANGMTNYLVPTIDPDTFKALATRAGGEAVQAKSFFKF